jgi:hypothetical protein
MSLFSKAKDRLVEPLALAFLNTTVLKPYGQVTSIRIDSMAKNIRARVELKGEATPIEVEITQYTIRPEGERYFAEVRGIRTSREWLTILATNHLQNVPVELPAQLGRILSHAL